MQNYSEDSDEIILSENDLSGPLKIENFTNLKSISLKKIKITSLEIIDCSQLTKVELSELIELKSLFVNGCPGLTKLDCSHKLTELTELSVSNLIELNCSNTSIKELSLILCPNIEILNCSNNNNLVKLDVYNCSKLKSLDCTGSKLISFDLSKCPNSINIKPSGLNITRENEKAKNLLIIGYTGSGKSALANVLTDTNDFEENDDGISVTKISRREFFEWEGTKYCVVDTVGIDNNRLSAQRVSIRIMEGIYSMPDGINQVLFVANNNVSTNEARMLESFEKEIIKCVTIVRTKFENFRSKSECKEDKNHLCTRSETIAKIINSYNGAVHVDIPQINIHNDEDRIKLNKKIRTKSRAILLDHLKKVSQNHRINPLGFFRRR